MYENIKFKDDDEKFEFENKVKFKFQKLAESIKSDLALLKDTKTIFSKVTKANVIKYIQYPEKYEKQLRNLSIGLYSQSTHYRRLIGYLSHMSIDKAYILSPYKLNIDKSKININTFSKSYYDHLNQIDIMNTPHEFKKIREDLNMTGIFYGCEIQEENSYYIKKLDPDYCRINGVVDGSFVFQFNFSYFSSNVEELSSYPPEFETKYNSYIGFKEDKKNNRSLVDNYMWQDITPQNSICIKLDETISYIAPPFMGLFLDIYDIQDYKELKKAREELQNYAMFIAKIPLNQNASNPDDFLLELDTAIEFANRFKSELPDQIGLGLSIFDSMTFEKMADTGTSDKDAVSESEKSLWDSAGVNQNMFSGESTTEGTMAFGVRTDEMEAFSINRQLERWVNRKFKYSFTKSKYLFRYELLDVTVNNYMDKFALYKQAVSLGQPVKLHMMATIGQSPSSVDNMLFLETKILELDKRLIPPLTSNVLSGANNANTDTNGGASTNEEKKNGDDE